jgi:hypothetical protein
VPHAIGNLLQAVVAGTREELNSLREKQERDVVTKWLGSANTHDAAVEVVTLAVRGDWPHCRGHMPELIATNLLRDCVAMRKEYRKVIKASVQAQVHHSHHFGAWFAADASRRERHVSDEATKLVGRVQRLQQERRTVEAEKDKMRKKREQRQKAKQGQAAGWTEEGNKGKEESHGFKPVEETAEEKRLEAVSDAVVLPLLRWDEATAREGLAAELHAALTGHPKYAINTDSSISPTFSKSPFRLISPVLGALCVTPAEPAKVRSALMEGFSAQEEVKLNIF